MKAIFAHDHIFYKSDNELYSNGGLSNNVLQRYLNHFEKVTVVSRQREIGYTKTERLTKITLSELSFIEVPNFKSITSINLRTKAFEIIDKAVLESDCVIARLPSSIGNIAIECARKHCKPYIIEVVGCTFDANYNHGNIIGKVYAPYSYVKMRRNVKKAPYVNYITERFLQKRYPSKGKVSVCPNVVIQENEKNIEKLRLKKIVDSDINEKFKIGLIGSLEVRYKGHKELIMALKQVVKKYPNVKVHFLGKGDTSTWKKLIEKNDLQNHVVFEGTLPNGLAVLNWIDSLDLLVQPSTAEGQGRSIIEGMSRGCPVIGTNVGGIVELLDEEMLVPKRNSKHLSKKIIRVMEDKEIMCNQAKRNIVHAKKFSQERIESARNKSFSNFIESI